MAKSDTVPKFLWSIEGECRLMRHLKRKYKAVGKLAYLEIIEAIAKSEGHALDLSNELDLEDLADEACTDAETLREIIQYCVTYGRFDAQLWQKHKIVWCDKFIEQVEEFYQRNRKRPAPKKPEVAEDQHPRNAATFPRNSADDRQFSDSDRSVKNGIEKNGIERKGKEPIPADEISSNEMVSPNKPDYEAGWNNFLDAFELKSEKHNGVSKRAFIAGCEDWHGECRGDEQLAMQTVIYAAIAYIAWWKRENQHRQHPRCGVAGWFQKGYHRRDWATHPNSTGMLRSGNSPPDPNAAQKAALLQRMADGEFDDEFKS